VRRSWASETGSFAEVPELVDLASGPHCICAGPASAEEVERRFVFHRISVAYGKQCLSSPLIHFALVVTDFSRYKFFLLPSFSFPFMGFHDSLKRQCTLKAVFYFPFWNLCSEFSMGGVSVH